MRCKSTTARRHLGNGATPSDAGEKSTPLSAVAAEPSSSGTEASDGIPEAALVPAVSPSQAEHEDPVDLDVCESGSLETCAQTMPEGAAPAEEVDVDKKWIKFKSYGVVQRTLEIWGFVISFFFRLWLCNRKFMYKKEDRDPEAKSGIDEDAKSQRLSELASWLRERLVKLGPTFIKVGQQFSTRSDVLSQEFIQELEKLQDRVPPFSSVIALETIETELGCGEGGWREKFSQLEPEPIAAASLGQVHRAVLLDGKTQAVVKVQRPGLRELFDVDTKNIRFVAQILQNLDPKTDGAARDWVAIYDECCRILYQEIDYELEGRYADRFRMNFEDVPWVKVPRVYWDLTTQKVLALEYSPGVKVSDKARLVELGVDPQVIAKYSVECYLQQILVKGLFHADPHPGNIAVDATDPKDPKLIFYDFGMMGEIPSGVKDGLVNFFYGVYKRDVDSCITSLVKMGVLVPNANADMTAIKRTGQFFLDSFVTRLAKQREEKKQREEAEKNGGAMAAVEVDGVLLEEGNSADKKKKKRKQILANIGQDLLVVAADQPFRFPALFTFVVRAFSVLDGNGKRLDERFDISEISAPYARDLLLESRPTFTKLQENIERRADRQWRAAKGLFVSPLRIERVEQVLDSLERGDVKLRVRALEAERALERVSVMQQVTTNVVLAATAFNAGVTLNAIAGAAKASLASRAMVFTGALFGLLALTNLAKLKKLEKKERLFSGQT